jgi:hypothetical protein
LNARVSSLIAAVWFSALIESGAVYAKGGEEVEVAELLIALLQAGCSVVSKYQPLINDPSKGNKGFTGEFVERAIIEKFQANTHVDWAQAKTLQQNDLLSAMLQSERDVVFDAQPAIDRQGIGFKGFLPSVFARKTGDKLFTRTGVKVKFARAGDLTDGGKPDDFEAEVLRMFADTRHPKGQRYIRLTVVNGKPVLRAMYPEYADAPHTVCPRKLSDAHESAGLHKQRAEEALACAISVVMPLH